MVFPAVGAVLLSGYLGFKSVVINSPDVKKFGAPVAVLHDTERGKVSGMPPRSTKHLPRFEEYRGAELINDLQPYKSFQDSDMPSILREAHDEPRGPSLILIEHLLEYAILKWLTNSDMWVGYVAIRPIQLINSGGASGGVPTDLVQVPTSNGANETNPFMKLGEIKLTLPKGSRVIRTNDNGPKIEILTNHSTIQIQFDEHTMSGLSTPIGSDAERIHEALLTPTLRS